jgi:hypothetical protein
MGIKEAKMEGQLAFGEMHRLFLGASDITNNLLRK